VAPEDDAVDLLRVLALKGSQMLLRVLQLLQQGHTSKKSGFEARHNCPKIAKEEARVEWTTSALAVQQPDSGARTRARGVHLCGRKTREALAQQACGGNGTPRRTASTCGGWAGRRLRRRRGGASGGTARGKASVSGPCVDPGSAGKRRDSVRMRTVDA
jgi:hypothetical protein